MTGMSVFYDQETVISVNDIKEAAESGAEEITESLNMVQQFLKDLPEKCFRFGAKILFAIILLFKFKEADYTELEDAVTAPFKKKK